MMELSDYQEYIVKNGFVNDAKSEYYKNRVNNYLKLKTSEKISENRPQGLTSLLNFAEKI